MSSACRLFTQCRCPELLQSVSNVAQGHTPVTESLNASDVGPTY